MGILHSSANIIQPEATYFTITNISDYLPNEAGIPTLKMDVAYRCVIKAPSSGLGIPAGVVLEGKGVIAVGKE
jgi:hypothetical protein